MSGPTKVAIAILCAVAGVAFVLFCLKILGLQDRAVGFLIWVQNASALGQITFTLVMAASVVIFLPGILFALGAGFIFGLAHGAVLVIAAETIGATIALYLGRYAKGAGVLNRFAENQRMEKIRTAPELQDWRWIALLRMIPFFPFKLSNYAFGFTPVSIQHYLLGTFVGLWPITIFNVYVGSIAGDMSSLGTTAAPRSPEHWAVYTAGFVASALAVILLARRAQKTLNAL